MKSYFFVAVQHSQTSLKEITAPHAKYLALAWQEKPNVIILPLKFMLEKFERKLDYNQSDR